MSVAEELRNGVNEQIDNPPKPNPVKEKTQGSDKTARPETPPTPQTQENQSYDSRPEPQSQTYGAGGTPTPSGTVVINAAAEEEEEKYNESVKTISDKNIRKLFDKNYDPTAPEEDDVNVGETGTTHDHDPKTDANLDPIKVQKGDFIDFLMEDVVLNGFVGWIGGKLAGASGVIVYDVSRWAFKKTISDPAKYIGKKFNKFKEKSEKERVEDLKKAAKTWTEENDLKPLDNDSARTVYIKKILHHHNANLEQIEGLSSQYSIDTFTKHIKEGNFEKITFSNLSPELNESIQKRFAEMKKMAPADQEAAINFLTENLKDAMLKEQQIACVVSAYAATRMMNEKNKNPAYNANASNSQIGEEYNQLCLNAREEVLRQMSNPSFDMEKLITEVNTMFETEFANHKKLDQKEKNNSNETIEIKNETLDRLLPQYGSSTANSEEELLKKNKEKQQEIDSYNERLERLKEERLKVNQAKENGNHREVPPASYDRQKGTAEAVLNTELRFFEQMESSSVSINFSNQKAEKETFLPSLNGKPGDFISMSFDSNDNKLNLGMKDKEDIPAIEDFSVAMNALKKQGKTISFGEIENDEYKARLFIAACNNGVKITNLKDVKILPKNLTPETSKSLQMVIQRQTRGNNNSK